MVEIEIVDKTGKKKLGTLIVKFAKRHYTIESKEFDITWNKNGCLAVQN